MEWLRAAQTAGAKTKEQQKRDFHALPYPQITPPQYTRNKQLQYDKLQQLFLQAELLPFILTPGKTTYIKARVPQRPCMNEVVSTS